MRDQASRAAFLKAGTPAGPARRGSDSDSKSPWRRLQYCSTLQYCKVRRRRSSSPSCPLTRHAVLLKVSVGQA